MCVRFSFWGGLALLCLIGCEELEPPPQLEDRVLGGVSVKAETLEAGRQVYRTRCRSCHGDFGDGNGPLGYHQRPKAADLRRGLIKFASVQAGALPVDSDIKRILKRGLKGTAMLAWPLEDHEIESVTQYIKTFSERWEEEKPGKSVKVGPDPWLLEPDGKGAAVRRGKELFTGLAACQSCHGESVREKMGAPSLKDGTFKAGDSAEDLYRVIAAGIGGSAMPAWEGALRTVDIWALVYYLRDLREKK